jgi:hypothetical protein
MAKLSYTEHEHYLIRSLVLLSEMVDATEADVFSHDGIRAAVGKNVPEGTFKMVHKDALQTLTGNMTFNQFFKRTSQTKRKAK